MLSRSICFIALFLASACMNSQVVYHSFQFDTRFDGQQDVEILDYRYGDSKEIIARAPLEDVRNGRVFYAQSGTGRMLRGKDLYVKWRLKNSNKVYEETVLLDKRLPQDIDRGRVYFMIHGEQLFVYFISKERRLKEDPDIGPRMYRDQKISLIYPNDQQSGRRN